MFVKRRDNAWVVTEINDNHNHPLIKKWSLTGYLRSHRHIPEEEQQFVKLLHSCNLEPSRQMQLLTELHGQREAIGYTDKDLANLLAKFRAEHKYTDMQDTIEYFKSSQQLDKDFFYKYKLDDEDKVQCIYWIDGSARRAYKFFSDCVSFDTTYLTNIYKMPCAPFIGINNHGQSIQFGCGFVRNELSTSFVWLFETFLEAMRGLAPTNIITDQDFAMRSAIQDVFPNTTHRNCRWHIMQNATEKLGAFLAKKPELQAEFNDCVNDSYAPEEFEARWIAMVRQHGVAEHPDFVYLYEKRRCWVPAYFMHKFYPFLQTTQRSEGFNAVLKKYVNPQNSIMDFIRQYATIQEKIMCAESKQDADTTITTARRWSYNPIELQMSSIYTRNIFLRFQGEMQSLLSYSCKQMGAQEYMVDCIAKFVPGYGNKSFKVHANVEEGFYMCECCKYERDGIVCCHILRIMVQLGVTTLPAAYILKRWTWLADEMLVDMSSQVPGKVHEMPEESVILMKTTLMKNEFASLAKVGCRTADGRKIIGTHLKEMKRELAALAKEQKKRRSRADFAAVSSATAASAPSMSKYAAQPAHSAPIHGFNNQGRSSCGVPFEPSIMGHGATAVSTHTMSNTATPSVYTSPSVASSNNQGRSSNAAAFDPQIEGQSALLAAMSAPVMPNPAAPGVYSAQLGASTRQGHSTYVAPAEPNILGYGATATPAALGAYSARSALPAAACAPATQPMSRSATPGVYIAQAAPPSNNKGHSSRAAAFKTQNQCQNASMTVMSESASAWPMAPATTVISTPVGGSNNQHHSSHVVAPEPIIRDPEKSNTKGRKRKKSFQHPLNIGKREKRTCRLCGSVTHDARTCLTRENPAPLQTEEDVFFLDALCNFHSIYIYKYSGCCLYM
uniref:SWIM-type domain-containing protein n=1 Tax=Hordeum vulgare subsp. vulgare TaxID=112509 RepID=A0A8I6X7M0_HORVV